MTTHWKVGLYWSGGGVLCFLCSVAYAVSWGSVDISFWQVWQVIVAQFFPFISVDPTTETIVWQLRLPRVLLASVVGASLAVAGVIFQGLLKNQLADPYILGISSGSAAGAVLAIVIGWSAAWISILAFLGACLALIMVLQLAKHQGRLSARRLILSGVVVQSFFGAVVTFCLSISYDKVQTIVHWMLGNLALAEWHEVWLAGTILWSGFVVGWIYSRKLNILALGDHAAQHLGIAVEPIRVSLLLIAALITAVSVSVSGMIGFVGLVVPHMVRLLIGTDHRVLLPVAMLFGASFLVGADALSRLLVAPRELSIGVITAMIGAPFFAFLLHRSKQQGVFDYD